jgi:hypothetical protein
MKMRCVVTAVLIALPGGLAAQSPAATHLQAAHELLEVSRTQEAIAAALAASLEAQYKVQPGLRGLESVMEQFFERHLSWDRLGGELATLWASRFTEAELRELTAFYRSPIGSKLAAETAHLTVEASRIGERMVEDHLDELGEMVVAAAHKGHLVPGQPVRGQLSDGDLTLDDGEYFQVYSIELQAGDRVRLTLRSGDFDAFLGLFGDDMPAGCGEGCSYDDDSGGGTDAMLRITAPADGMYQVLVTSALVGETGEFTLLAELLEAAPAAEVRAIAIGESRDGSINEADAELDRGTYYHLYRFEGLAGQQLEITLRSADFDAYLFLDSIVGATWQAIEEDDDSAGGSDARVTVRLEDTAAYFLRVTTYAALETGLYTLEIREFASAR